MTKRSVRRLASDSSGVVAPVVALSLFALIAVGGIAFDYARLATMDTELQDAADQAALAGASQLDGQSGAVNRAVAAAQSLLVNRTLLGNDGAGTAVQTGTGTTRILFYTNKPDAEADTNGILASAATDAAARFIKVDVVARRANYALTPIARAFSSGDVGAAAVAGLGSAICKVPPVMICNPQETSTVKTFDATGLIGDGLRLVSVGGGNGSWAPGNFGYLDSFGGSNGAPGLREALGWNTPPGDCQPSNGVDTKPGATVSVTDALNTRFDIYDSNVSCPSGGACGASIDSVKDVLRPANANGGNSCKLHNQGWQEVASASQYLPTSATAPLATTPGSMGHPRDMCHAVASGTTGECTGPIGNGLWDRDAYFRTHYLRSDGTRWTSANWQANTGLSPSVAPTAANYASRYNVYKWEIANRGIAIDGVTVLASSPPGASGNTLVAYGLPQCSASEGYGTGIVPAATVVDRRRISVAVVNCTQQNVHGAANGLTVVKWVDMFLVQPSLNRARTNAGDVYAEVIGETQSGAAGQTAGQVVKRDTPYLVR
ncbi:MAG: pilus assembly protein TadG-related protein [Sphingomicrobium sp.]